MSLGWPLNVIAHTACLYNVFPLHRLPCSVRVTFSGNYEPKCAHATCPFLFLHNAHCQGSDSQKEWSVKWTKLALRCAWLWLSALKNMDGGTIQMGPLEAHVGYRGQWIHCFWQQQSWTLEHWGLQTMTRAVRHKQIRGNKCWSNPTAYRHSASSRVAVRSCVECCH